MGDRLTFQVVGAHNWRGELVAKARTSHFQVGFYNGAQRYPFHNKAFGGLTLVANYSGCNQSIGWFAIDKSMYLGDTAQLQVRKSINLYIVPIPSPNLALPGLR